MVVAGVLGVGGCASGPRRVTKIVNGRVVATRAVSPEAYNHVARALLYEEEERWDEAARELQRALPFDPEAAEIRAHLAELFVKLGRLDDAAEQIARSREIAPTVEVELAAAKLAEARRQRPAAIAHLRAAVERARENEDAGAIAETHLLLSDALLAALDLAGAHQAATSLVALLPENAAAHVELAALTWSQGDGKDAEASLRRALAIEPAHLEARLMLAALLAALGRPAEAKVAFREAIDRTEDAVDVAEPYLRWLVGRGEGDEAAAEAERLAPDVITEDTIDATARLMLAAGRPERAKQAAETAIAKAADPKAPPVRLVLLLASATIELGDRAGAAARLLAIRPEREGALEARLLAAEALREAGRTDDAARALDQAKTATPLNKSTLGASAIRDRAPDLAIARALLDERRGDAARAARILDEAIADRPTDVRLLLARAAVDERRGEWRRALAFAERILEREPRRVEALNFHGFVSADHDHDLPAAVRRLHVAVALDPGAGGIMDSLGWAYFKLGELARAKDRLVQADRLEPGDPEILGHLGELHLKLGEPARALALFRTALGKKPADRLAKDLQQRVRELEARSAAER